MGSREDSDGHENRSEAETLPVDHTDRICVNKKISSVL